MKVIHIIVSLDTGGAETMLIKLIENSPPTLQHLVLTFRPHSPRALKLIENGYNITKVSFWKMIKTIKTEKPDILMGWLFHGCFLSAFVKLIFGFKTKVIWNIRYSEFPKSNFRNILIVRVLKIISHLVDGIIYNSYAGKKVHEDMGYNPKNSKVIYNGFNLDLFTSNVNTQIQFKKDHQLPENSFLFGMVGRFDKLKNQIQFINYAKEFLSSIKEENRNIYFVFIGKNMDKTNKVIQNLLIDFEFENRFILLGEQKNLQKFYPCFDVHCLYSTTEGFPNVIGESMACEVPCIASDVGDVKRIIGDTGWVVPINDKNQLFFAFNQAYEANLETRKELGQQARQKIIDNYSLRNVIQEYSLFLESQ
ncbi:MAG: glycosyltransferase [Bdellovibrionaceae bacterium]|nr:glycosyltransferase [Pseudobdellovibrionaceae bacterium]